MESEGPAWANCWSSLETSICWATYFTQNKNLPIWIKTSNAMSIYHLRNSREAHSMSIVIGQTTWCTKPVNTSFRCNGNKSVPQYSVLSLTPGRLWTQFWDIEINTLKHTRLNLNFHTCKIQLLSGQWPSILHLNHQYCFWTLEGHATLIWAGKHASNQGPQLDPQTLKYTINSCKSI